MTLEDRDSLSVDRKFRTYLPNLGMDYRDAIERVHDFREVAIPFTEERAKFEAQRCIQCPAPAGCVTGCPVHNDIPGALWLVEQGRYEEAAQLFRQTSTLPEICGRVCPQEQLCQGSCVHNIRHEPVLIGASEVFFTNYELEHSGFAFKAGKPTGKKVAILGAGPAGLACAARLAEMGHSVTIFDDHPLPGGLLMYGIPGFKLENEILAKKIDQLLAAGIEFVTQICVGEDITIPELLEQAFHAVFIGIGAGVDVKMQIPGEDLPEVFRSSEFLIRTNVQPADLPLGMTALTKIGPKVTVIGGGDTASDCLRTSLRMGISDLTCIYRRTEREMPGGRKDRGLAKDEGAKYLFLTQPIRFIPNEEGHLQGIECIKMELGAPDARGRRTPVAIEGSNFIIPADTAVLALGYNAHPAIVETTPGLQTHKGGLVIINPETGASSLPGVFAGGDAVRGPDLVVTGVADGQVAAKGINAYLETL